MLILSLQSLAWLAASLQSLAWLAALLLGWMATILCRSFGIGFVRIFSAARISIQLSHLHACVFSLFLTIHNKFNEVHLDNLYMSAKFVHILYTHNNCVNVEGVC